MSSTKFSEGVVSRSAFSENRFTCPSCGNRKVTMTGRYERLVTMQYTEGEMTDRKMEEGEPSIRFTHVICAACHIDFSIEADYVYLLRSANLQLHVELAKALGKSALDSSNGDRLM